MTIQSDIFWKTPYAWFAKNVHLNVTILFKKAIWPLKLLRVFVSIKMIQNDRSQCRYDHLILENILTYQ